MNIGFLQFGMKGDMMLATSIMRDVRAKHPCDHITWVCLDINRCVIQDNPHIDNYITWPLDPGIPRQKQELRIYDIMKDYCYRTFQKTYIPQHYPDNMGRYKERQHLIDYMYRNAGIRCVHPKRLVFESNRRDVRRAITWLHRNHLDRNRRLVTANTRSNTARSVWSAKQWEELAFILGQRNWTLVVGGDEKIEGAANFSGSWGSWHHLIEKSVCYVGLDSGGTWLAASTDTPQICLRSSQNECPIWFTGLASSHVKGGCVEFPDPPSPSEVYRSMPWHSEYTSTATKDREHSLQLTPSS